MNIKLLTSDDWKKLRDIRIAGLKSDPQAFVGSCDEEMTRTEMDWRKRIENPQRIFVVAEEDNIFVSLAGAINIDGDWTLVGVHTLPHYRGKGYAKQVIQYALDEVKKRGATKIILMVNVDQKNALHIYETLGFKIIETVKDQKMGDGLVHDEYVMQLDVV